MTCERCHRFKALHDFLDHENGRVVYAKLCKQCRERKHPNTHARRERFMIARVRD